MSSSKDESMTYHMRSMDVGFLFGTIHDENMVLLYPLFHHLQALLLH